MSDDVGLPCVHCGLCLEACPTYRVLGTEADSPRGRILIMEAVKSGELELDHDGAAHLDGCLGCLACETVCPSGVDYGLRIEEMRPQLREQAAGRRLRERFVERGQQQPRILRTALYAAYALDRLGLGRLRRRLPGFGLVPGHGNGDTERSPLKRSRIQQPRRPRARAALLGGCVADQLLPDVNRAAVESLQRNGVEVVDLVDLGCCGALAHHEGRHDAAHDLMERNVAAVGRAAQDFGIDYVVSTAAGCSAFLKQYPRLLASTAAARSAALLAERSREICELLLELGFEGPRKQTGDLVAYHDACHLIHGQSIREAPRAVCMAATGSEPIDLGENDTCCGSGGSYNLTHPAMAEVLGDRKAQLAENGGASLVAVANPGCQLQLARSFALRKASIDVRHPVELLAEAYRRSGTWSST